jgi:hypothetical protein
VSSSRRFQEFRRSGDRCGWQRLLPVLITDLRISRPVNPYHLSPVQFLQLYHPSPVYFLYTGIPRPQRVPHGRSNSNACVTAGLRAGPTFVARRICLLLPVCYEISWRTRKPMVVYRCCSSLLVVCKKSHKSELTVG